MECLMRNTIHFHFTTLVCVATQRALVRDLSERRAAEEPQNTHVLL